MAQEPTNNTLNISTKSVAKYALLPGILPRLQRLAMHFSQFLFIFTQIFGSVGLIPKNHPCLRAENIGRYRFRDIMGLAASNVIFDRKHLPQIVMFFMVVLSIVLTAAIVLGLIASTIFTVHHAEAQFFGQPEGVGNVKYIGPDGDWALNFLYRIFGDTGIFPYPKDKNIGNPWFTSILVGMLKYYSLAMLVVASFMMLYILVTTLTEAAKSGQPFGTKFDSIWAPIRLALAIGMLMPISHGGYNGAQMMTFQVALWGSNLATNVWYGGLNNMNQDSKKFFSTVMGDPGYRFVRDMFVVNLCVAGLKKQSGKNDNMPKDIVYSITEDSDSGVSTYTFGTKDAPDFCGQVNILTSNKKEVPKDLKGNSWPDKVITGYKQIATAFIPADTKDDSGDADVNSTVMGPAVNYASDQLIGEDADKQNGAGYIAVMDPTYNGKTIQTWVRKYWTALGVMYVCREKATDEKAYASSPPTNCSSGSMRSQFFESPTYKPSIDAYNNWIITHMSSDAQYGWTTAGVFYLRISSAFAAISEVVNNAPVVSKMPANFTKMFATTINQTQDKDNVEKFCSNLGDILFGWAGGSSAECRNYKTAREMNSFLRGGKDWFLSAVQNDNDVHTEFGTQEFDHILELQEPDTSQNGDTSNLTGPVLSGRGADAKISSSDMNPLGAVISWGNTFLGYAKTAFILSLATMGSGFSEMAWNLGMTLLIPGFVLAYWVPTIPFMHFTFAVIEWMMSILEAVIGMPLWSLSLITLEGDGLGRLGMEGIKRLFEILLRPTIIIMSLIVAIIIFTACISFFNSALALYQDASPSGGAGERWSWASFGMLFVYMFGVYTLATASFKVINTIPDGFGRWMGLPRGFGSEIKTGMSDLDGLIAGGAALKSLNNVGGGVKSVGKGVRGGISQFMKPK